MKIMYKCVLMISVIILMILPLVSSNLDVQWTCPISGTSATTDFRRYLTYENEAPYKDCYKAGNNLTIEFAVTGDGNDFEATKGASIDLSATLYIYKGSNSVMTLPLNANFTNTSATSTGLVRFTDFGELYTSGITGSAKWVNNMTYSDYKFYVAVQNVTSGTGVDVLASEPGMYLGDAFRVEFRNPQSRGAYLAEAALAGVEGTEEVQALMGLTKPSVISRGNLQGLLPVIGILLIIGFLFFSKSKTR